MTDARLQGGLRLWHGDRSAVVRRTADGWLLGPRAFASKSELAKAAISWLALTPRYGLLVAFDGAGLNGTIRDAGAPSESYILDCDSRARREERVLLTLHEAIVALLENLEAVQA
jgi:hypothetical protein